MIDVEEFKPGISTGPSNRPGLTTASSKDSPAGTLDRAM